METLLILVLIALWWLYTRRPPKAPVTPDAAETRRRAVAQQEWHNFLHYAGDTQPPIDPYVTAHHAVQK